MNEFKTATNAEPRVLAVVIPERAANFRGYF